MGTSVLGPKGREEGRGPALGAQIQVSLQPKGGAAPGVQKPAPAMVSDAKE